MVDYMNLLSVHSCFVKGSSGEYFIAELILIVEGSRCENEMRQYVPLDQGKVAVASCCI
jgi:hypothetical protein